MDQNTNGKVFSKVLPFVHDGGAEGIRTPYPFLAKEMLSRMSYSPTELYYINKGLFQQLIRVLLLKEQTSTNRDNINN